MPLNYAEAGKIVVPLTRIIFDGDKRYRQIVGFAVVDEVNVIGMYEGQGGFVSDISMAVDIRGPAGKMVMETNTEVVEVEGPPGKSAYELWIAAGNTGSMQDFFNSLKGSNASLTDIRLSVAQYLTDNPPAPGQNATPAQISDAVNAWLMANPPKDGEDGNDATDQQIAAAVQVYLLANPAPRGPKGEDATPLQIYEAASNYLMLNPPAPGTPGKSVELQLASGFIQWRQTDGSWMNLVALSQLAGKDGINGTNGTNGTNGKNIQLQKTSTAIQWRLEGGTWADLIAVADLKGDKGDAGQTLLQQINVTDTALLAISLGTIDKRYNCAGAVVGERYLAFIRSYKLNNAPTATAGKPDGFWIVSADCQVAGTINIVHQRPAIVLNGKYELFTDIVKVNAS